VTDKQNTLDVASERLTRAYKPVADERQREEWRMVSKVYGEQSGEVGDSPQAVDRV